MQAENALAVVVQVAKVVLRVGMSLRVGFFVLLPGLAVVLRHAFAGVVLYAEVVPVFRVTPCDVLLIRLWGTGLALFLRCAAFDAEFCCVGSSVPHLQQ